MTRRKDGLWQEVVKINGKTKYFYGRTKAEVLDKIRNFKESQERGLTVSDAVDKWLEWKSERVSYKTVQGYQPPTKRIKAYFAGDYLKDVSPARVQSFVDCIAALGYKRTTVQRPLDVLRMVYDYYIVQPRSTIIYNPCASVKLPSGLTQQCRDLANRKDIEIVKNSLHVDFGLFAYLIMYSGLRDGEALALRREDIDDNYIYVSKSVSWQPNKPVLKEPKTKNGIRRVDLLDPLKKALPDQSGFLFSADGGQSPLTNTQFRRRWNNYCRAAGLAEAREESHYNAANKHKYKRVVWTNRIVPYQLRHEFATLCFDAGLDPHDVQILMGHADESTARKIYTHVLESRRVSAAKKLNDYVNNV